MTLASLGFPGAAGQNQFVQRPSPTSEDTSGKAGANGAANGGPAGAGLYGAAGAGTSGGDASGGGQARYTASASPGGAPAAGAPATGAAGSDSLDLASEGHPDIPKWIPLVAGVVVRPTVKTKEGGTASGLFSFEIRAAVRDAAEFYKRFLKQQGVPVQERVEEEGGQPVMAQLDARGSRKVQIQIARQGERSRITVAYSAP